MLTSHSGHFSLSKDAFLSAAFDSPSLQRRTAIQPATHTGSPTVLHPRPGPLSQRHFAKGAFDEDCEGEEEMKEKQERGRPWPRKRMTRDALASDKKQNKKEDKIENKERSLWASEERRNNRMGYFSLEQRRLFLERDNSQEEVNLPDLDSLLAATTAAAEPVANSPPRRAIRPLPGGRRRLGLDGSPAGWRWRRFGHPANGRASQRAATK